MSAPNVGIYVTYDGIRTQSNRCTYTLMRSGANCHLERLTVSDGAGAFSDCRMIRMKVLEYSVIRFFDGKLRILAKFREFNGGLF